MIIEIVALENGAHRNQSGGVSSVPAGWAAIPDCIAIPATFPFVGVEAAEIDGVMTVTSMTEGVVPEPDPEPVAEPTELEQLRADVDFIAMETGVEL